MPLWPRTSREGLTDAIGIGYFVDITRTDIDLMGKDQTMRPTSKFWSDLTGQTLSAREDTLNILPDAHPGACTGFVAHSLWKAHLNNRGPQCHVASLHVLLSSH